MSYCKIYLDTQKDHFGPGDIIEGQVNCYFRSEKTVRAIKVRVVGAEHTEWMESESYYDSSSKSSKRRLVRHTGDNNFFSKEIFFLNSGGNSHVIPPGSYNYRFSVQLPSFLPGTFECSNGYVRYWIIAIVDRPMKFDIEDQIYFFVFSPVKLNSRLEHIQDPVQYSDEKNICCLCCQSGPIEFDVSLPKRGYVAGETIPINIRLTNMSNVSVESFRASLVMKLECRVTTPHEKHRYDEEHIASNTATGVGAHGAHEFQMTLVIPNDVIIPNFDSCTLMKAYPFMEITAVLPGCHSNMDIEIHPELGHMMLGGSTSNIRPPPFPTMGPSYPPAVVNNGTVGVPDYPGSGYPGANPGSGYPGANPGSGYPGANPGSGYPGANPVSGYPGANPGLGYPGAPYPPGASSSNVGWNPSQSEPGIGFNTSEPPPYPPGKGVYPPGPPTAPSGDSIDGFEMVGGPSTSSGKPVYPGGPPSAPAGSSKSKEQEAASIPTGPPSAPLEPPPPSYEESSKFIPPYPPK